MSIHWPFHPFPNHDLDSKHILLNMKSKPTVKMPKLSFLFDKQSSLGKSLLTTELGSEMAAPILLYTKFLISLEASWFIHSISLLAYLLRNHSIKNIFTCILNQMNPLWVCNFVENVKMCDTKICTVNIFMHFWQESFWALSLPYFQSSR